MLEMVNMDFYSLNDIIKELLHVIPVQLASNGNSFWS